MIPLHPVPEANHSCPYCQRRLEAVGWYMPGMRNLADLTCPECRREFYGDLPAGHGLYYPMLLEKSSGKVHDPFGVPWFASWLEESYARRSSEPVSMTVEEFAAPKRAILLNCLDRVYGHSLLKLLNAQYYLDHAPDRSLIVLVQRPLRWLVPDGVAAVWTLDAPFSRGADWSDWLAQQIRSRVQGLEECSLSIAIPHPHHDDFDIQRFSRLKPFPVEEWRLRTPPTVTFVWREDRCWSRPPRVGAVESLSSVVRLSAGIPQARSPASGFSTRDEAAPARADYPPILRTLRPLAVALRRREGRRLAARSRKDQLHRVAILAQTLRSRFPSVDFAVAGLGKRGGLPAWVGDLREERPDERAERAWCERYAASHVAIGVQGSNMLLPSAHAGAIVELVVGNRWGNLMQDIVVVEPDARMASFRYQFLPGDATPGAVADVASSVLDYFPIAALNFARPWCDHENLRKQIHELARRRAQLAGRLRDW